MVLMMDLAVSAVSGKDPPTAKPRSGPSTQRSAVLEGANRVFWRLHEAPQREVGGGGPSPFLGGRRLENTQPLQGSLRGDIGRLSLATGL